MSELHAETTAAGSHASDLIASLRLRAPRAAMAWPAAQAARPLVQRLRGKYRERATYTVKVLSTDDVYDDLHEWVLGMLPPADQHALVAWTSNSHGMAVLEPMSSDGPPKPRPPRVRLRYDGSRHQSVRIGGHRIRVEVTEGEASKDSGRIWKPDEIVFTASSLAAQKALIDAIEAVARRRAETDRQPVFRMLNRWGDWRRLDDLPARALDSVILPDGQLERIIGDVQGFLDAEADYARRCVPWHRGHLYEGPPGTGKTSVARAVASHFGMDIWYLPLADVDKDCNLLDAVSRVSPRSMLLLEDADVFHAATDRDEGQRVTLSGLLNALDGIATPQGILTVLTTNEVAALDSAVVRAGRVDLREHFGYADAGQVSRIVSRWYNRPVNVDRAPHGLAPSEVVEACKRSASPDEALNRLSVVERERRRAAELARHGVARDSAYGRDE